MPATVTGIHEGPDTHANRPAANAAGQPIGALYSCTTHKLIYKTDGSTWTTYATLGDASAYVPGGTDVAVADGGTGASTAAAARSNLGALADTDPVTYLDFVTAAAPSSPAAGKVRVYSKTGSHMTQKDSAGTETALDGAGGGGSGALTLLESHTASGSASLDFTASISASYDVYEVQFVGIRPSGTTVNLIMRCSTNGGSSYDSGANYAYNGLYNGNGDTLTALGSAGATGYPIENSTDTTANKSMNGRLRFGIPAGLQPSFESSVQSYVGGALYWWDFKGIYLSTTAVDAFQFLFSGGNIASGTIRVYGVAQ